MKTCLLVNPRSGGWRRNRSRLEQFARQTSVPILLEPDDQPLKQLLGEAHQQGCRRIIVAGGDGTLSRVVNQAAERLMDWEFALLPIGTGNDLARTLGLLGESWERVVNWAVSAPSCEVDLIRVSNGAVHHVVNAVTGGFGGIVGADVRAEDKSRWGAVAYWMTAFSKLSALEKFSIRLELDSRTIETTVYGLAIANGRYVGGGFPVAPNASPRDGLLDITTVPVLPTLELLAAGFDFSLGRAHHPERVRTYRSGYLRIHAEPTLPYSFDGEPTRSMDATFEVIPSSLRLVCNPSVSWLKSEPGATTGS